MRAHQGHGAGGEHPISNELLLRAEIHKVFDRRNAPADSDFRFVVSGRLKEFFQNGRHYYDLRVSRYVCLPNQDCTSAWMP